MTVIYERTDNTTWLSQSLPIYGYTWNAQRFTVGTSGEDTRYYISAVRVILAKSGSPDKLSISIRSADPDGGPPPLGNPDLGGGTFDMSGIGSPPGTWVTIPLTTAVAVEPDTPYDIIFGSPTSSDTNRILLGYSNGSMWDDTGGVGYISTVGDGPYNTLRNGGGFPYLLNGNMRSILYGRSSTTLSADGTSYYAHLAGGETSWTTYSARRTRDMIMPFSGTLRRLTVVIDQPAGSSKTWQFYVTRNDVNSMSVTFTGAGTSIGASVDSVAVIAGDKINFRCVSYSNPNIFTQCSWCVECEASTSLYSMLPGSCLPSTVSGYNALMSNHAPVSTDNEFLTMPAAGTITGMYTYASSTVSGGVVKLFMEKNGSDVYGCTLNAGTISTVNSSLLIPVSQGDYLTIRSIATTTIIPTINWTCIFRASIDGDFIAGSGYGSCTFKPSYLALAPSDVWRNSDTLAQDLTQFVRFNEMWTRLDTSVGGTAVFSLIKNLSATNMTCTLSGTTLVTSYTDTPVTGFLYDRFDIKATTIAGVGLTVSPHISFRGYVCDRNSLATYDTTGGKEPSYSEQVLYVRYPSDNMDMDDSNFSYATTHTGGTHYYTNASDYFGLKDSLLFNCLWNRLVTDSLGDSDVFSKQTNFVRSITDATGGLDIANRQANYTRAIANTMGDSDAFSRQGLFGRAISDTVGDSDSLAKQGLYVRLIADTMGDQDTIARQANYVRAIAEVVRGYDSLLRIIGKLFTDTMSGAEGRNIADSRSIANTSQHVDTYARMGVFTRPMADNTNMTEIFNYSTLHGNQYSSTFADITHMVDVLTRQLIVTRNLTDNSQQQDNQNKALSRILADSMKGAENQNKTDAKAFSDYSQQIDVYSRTALFMRSPTEYGPLVDSYVRGSGIFNRPLSDAFPMVEFWGYTTIHGAGNIYSTFFGDSVPMMDTLSRSVNFKRSLSDESQQQDPTLSRQMSFARILADGSQQQDTRNLALYRTLLDYTQQKDVYTKSTLFTRGLSDIAGLIDIYQRGATSLHYTFTEGLGFYEYILSQLPFYKFMTLDLSVGREGLTNVDLGKEGIINWTYTRNGDAVWSFDRGGSIDIALT